MRKYSILFVSCAFFVLASCTKVSVGPSLEGTLLANPKLQVVLDKYKDDSLKYKAAVFLIENLPYHYGYEGEPLNDYLKIFELHSKDIMSPNEVLDSIRRACGPLRMDKLEQKSDIYIDPAYLIENIEWAFKVWREQPWGKNVPFDDFCEFILPYRVGDEKLEPWRERIYNKYNPMLDSIRGLPEAEDPKYVSQILVDILHNSNSPIYFTELFSFGPHYGPKVVDWRSGSCLNLTYLQLYVFRALGLPCSEEIMLMRGNKNAPHYWNAVFDKDGNSYRCSILDPTSELSTPDSYWDPKGKVYRRTFSVNWEMTRAMGKQAEEIYPSFRYPCFRDVSDIYIFQGSEIRAFTIAPEHFYRPLKKDEPVYLCSACFMDWEPIGWCLYDEYQGAAFENVEGQVIFRLGTYENGKLCLQTDPFLFDRDNGEIHFFPSDGKETEIILLFKYELYFEPFVRRMMGGVFEGSNDPHFNKKDTLFLIRDLPERLWNVARVKNDHPYRYVRFYGAQDSYCNVSEIAFYASSADSVPLKGKIIGTPGGVDDSHEYTNAFDGDPYTSFSYSQPTGGWSGLDLGAPRRIEKIIFTPRNRDNFIRIDDEYELFYCQNGEWTSAGRAYPHSDSLLYKVPEGALLYLRDHTRGREERIFEYKDGKQRFW